MSITPSSTRRADAAEFELVEAARRVIDAHTDAAAGQDGVHTMGAAVRADDGRIFVGVEWPCGRDRQVLADLYPGIRIVLPIPAGIVSVLIGDLLPYGFDTTAEHS